MNSVLILLLTFLLLAGSYCWGSLVSQLLKSKQQTDLPALFYIPIGIAAFLTFSGYLMAINFAKIWLLILWHIAGLLTEVFFNFHHYLATFSKISKNISVVCQNFFIITLTSIFGLGIVSTRVFQTIDDFPTYLYFARKIADTGGLNESFNSTRIASYCATSLYQAIFYKLTGSQSVFAFDGLFAIIALVLFIIGVCTLLRIHFLWKLFFSVVIVIGSSSTYSFNLSPWFITIYLSLALFVMLYLHATEKLKVPTWKFTLLFSVILAALYAVRPPNAIAPGVALLIYLIVMKRLSALSISASLAGIIFLCGGWSIASFRAFSSIGFPFPGNANPSYGSIIGKSDDSNFLSTLFASLQIHNQLIILLFVLGAITYFIMSKKFNLSAVLLSLLIGSLMTIAGLVVVLKGFDPWMISRYFAPTTFSLGIASSVVLLEVMSSRSGSVGEKKPLSSRLLNLKQPSTFLFNNILYIIVFTLIAMTTMSYQQALGTPTTSHPLLSVNYSSTYRNGMSLFKSGFVSFSKPAIDQLDPFKKVFVKLNDSIPNGSNVLAAVETPELLTMDKFNVQVLGWPGNGSPSPGAPFDSGPTAFMGYLKHLGFQYLLVETPKVSYGLYSYSQMTGGLSSSFPNYSLASHWEVKWSELVMQILQSNNTRYKILNGYALISTSWFLNTNQSSSSRVRDANSFIN